MSYSKSYAASSTESAVQLPLKGFRVRVESPKPNWDKFHEGMGEGRIRIHAVRKRPK